MPSASPFNLRRFLRNAAIIAVTVAVTVGGGIGLWEGFLKDRLVAKRFGEVTPAIYRSGQLSEHVVGRVLEEHRIARIVDLTEPEYLPPGKVRERQIAAEEGIEVLSFPLIGDGTGDVGTYADAVAALIESERAGTPTLVHCAAGSYRTSGVVAAFRILYQGWEKSAALAEAERFDWDSDKPAMRLYLAEHLEEIHRRLVERGALP
jgi:protein-tyrosine phosphatase